MWGMKSEHTLQMVNGRQQFNGSDRSRLERAIRTEQVQPQTVALRILSADAVGNSLTVKFSASGDNSLHGADIIAVLADDADQSSALRGENSGRNLTHVSVARSISRVAKFQSSAEQTVQLSLPAAFLSKPDHHLILFAQARWNGRVLGAEAKPLEESAPQGRAGN